MTLTIILAIALALAFLRIRHEARVFMLGIERQSETHK